MDYNNDGLTDLIAGDSAGQVTVFLNKGTKAKPVLAEGIKVKSDGKEITPTRTTYKAVNGKAVVDKTIKGSHKLSEVYSKLHMGDWDGDGLGDLLVGHSTTIVMYKNIGTKDAPKFAAPVKVVSPEGKFPMRPSPFVVDWDGDGTNDLLVGTEYAKVYFYKNEGTNQKPKLAKGEELSLKGDGFDKGYRCRIDVTDWNNDGKKDLLVGNFYSSRAAGKNSNGGNVWLFLGE